MNEKRMQAILMDYCMERKHHKFVLPNLRSLYRWEADLISATSAWLIHEMEIKLSTSDYFADANKKRKHHALAARHAGRGTYNTPNYFWYVTWGFDPPSFPSHAGWIRIERNRMGRRPYEVIEERPAPRLHGDKLSTASRIKLGRWLSYKLKNEYYERYIFGVE